jgi:hypothetical protein
MCACIDRSTAIMRLGFKHHCIQKYVAYYRVKIERQHVTVSIEPRHSFFFDGRLEPHDATIQHSMFATYSTQPQMVIDNP